LETDNRTTENNHRTRTARSKARGKASEAGPPSAVTADRAETGIFFKNENVSRQHRGGRRPPISNHASNPAGEFLQSTKEGQTEKQAMKSGKEQKSPKGGEKNNHDQKTQKPVRTRTIGNIVKAMRPAPAHQKERGRRILRKRGQQKTSEICSPSKRQIRTVIICAALSKNQDGEKRKKQKGRFIQRWYVWLV